MKPFFSVIIPTLNEERFLPRLLKNLAQQKSKNFEVVVVDGGSHDKTVERASEFIKKLELAVFKVKKRNVSYQRNQGASKAKGRYLIFIDADCQINTIFTKKLESFIKSNKGLIFLPYVDPEESSPEMKSIYQFLNFLIDFSQSTKKPFASVGCMIVERKLFDQLGGYNEKVFIGEDHLILKSAQKWGVKAKFIPTVKIKFSFRRIKKEGKLKSSYKLVKGIYYNIFKGDIKEKIFEYEMGGHHYATKQSLQKNHFEEKFKQIKNFFKRL